MSFAMVRTLRRATGHNVSEPLRPENVVELTDEDLAKVTGAWGGRDHEHEEERRHERHREEEHHERRRSECRWGCGH